MVWAKETLLHHFFCQCYVVAERHWVIGTLGESVKSEFLGNVRVCTSRNSYASFMLFKLPACIGSSRTQSCKAQINNYSQKWQTDWKIGMQLGIQSDRLKNGHVVRHTVRQIERLAYMYSQVYSQTDWKMDRQSGAYVKQTNSWADSRVYSKNDWKIGMQSCIQSDRLKDGQIHQSGIQSDRLKDRHTVLHTVTLTERWADSQAYSQTDWKMARYTLSGHTIRQTETWAHSWKHQHLIIKQIIYQSYPCSCSNGVLNTLFRHTYWSSSFNQPVQPRVELNICPWF